ncbi:UDP-glucose 4-epimerase protein [Marine Group I thaumarchaeote SCGC AAA799-B03]|uniref:UDP-glucose 4-epimerase protein n=4 Tax=Marine Group I TaxID=905826 RepID=A0A087S852_9ARCH|nr:UDP-glucose 4-epimerase protein [Marine Group I thaumarchaeote SCGC AAA799-N04]KFM16008.1 UDP-glucose 4-epimerase protein [Marine Group I thaumarchaeote SCGC AAA799-D11]KFM17745.1 UDP-glucose 4-epimerase protein [Marine Group I thaumarchaeote SCGC RSA3]KFM21906.1 UDP-glucose 4-epimerase protein [Marine Group I thaumarchaeote SCGC AAA799-B03]
MEQVVSQSDISHPKPFSILVTGATGFIGSKLISFLTSSGYTVKGLSRKQLPGNDKVKYVKADVFNFDELKNAMSGIETAFYLLHSMEGDKGDWQEFAAREKIQAQNFLRAATESGVKRIIYLGGLVNDSLDLSPHMRSRKEVGEILASGNIPVTEFRASIIIGAKGGSYAMLRYLVERLRVMVCPSWVKSLAQPIAVDDVVEYLAKSLSKHETIGKIFEIGGPDKMTYEELMRVYSAYLNKNLFVIQIPFLTTRLSSYWVDLITPVKASLARPLIDSLVHDTVVTDDSITKIIPIHLKSVREAIDIATKEMKSDPPQMEQREEKTGFKINQKLIQISLFALAVIGSSYYWLDDRPDVYQPLWLIGSAIWYIAIVSAIIFIHNKTRLGYLIAGVLSWITLAFWLFDNYYVVFETSLIANPPNELMMIRNFVGMFVVVLTVIASHNLFHKVIDYQYKGTPI